MKMDELLGQWSGLQQMMLQLVRSVPEPDAYRAFRPEVPPLAWLFGRSTYIETYWLCEILYGDEEMTARVRAFFGAGVQVDETLMRQLPPMEHLLHWATQLQEENLAKLANPAYLPEHSLLQDDRLPLLMLQEQSTLYELMLVQLTERRLGEISDYRVGHPLEAVPPSTDHADVHQGHYRIGAKEDRAARDNELPTQIVELHGFRIDRMPVTNGAFLSFIHAGGYEDATYWSDEGSAWQRQHGASRPHHWRRDNKGNWYGIGLNGPFELAVNDPVTGLSHHEAQAYANWVSSLGGQTAGAVLQHEYQWEVAARTRAISEYGRAWEWCANAFHPYTGYQVPEQGEAVTRDFGAGHRSLRGAGLHSRPLLRRISYRNHALPEQRFRFSGLRLVFPPSKMPWHNA